MRRDDAQRGGSPVSQGQWQSVCDVRLDGEDKCVRLSAVEELDRNRFMTSDFGHAEPMDTVDDAHRRVVDDDRRKLVMSHGKHFYVNWVLAEHSGRVGNRQRAHGNCFHQALHNHALRDSLFPRCRPRGLVKAAKSVFHAGVPLTTFVQHFRLLNRVHA
jgi:hypothetical protein